VKKNKITRQQLIQLLLTHEDDKSDIQELVDLLFEQQVSLNVNKETEKTFTIGDRASDKLAEFAGSWRFIIGFAVFLAVWIMVNMALKTPMDPFPFILLNLILSTMAAIQAPIIMMSQNRQEDKDRIRSQNDYKVNLKSELLLEDLHKKMDKILYSQKVIKEKLNIIEDNMDNDDDFVELV